MEVLRHGTGNGRTSHAAALDLISGILQTLTLLLPLRETLNRIATDVSVLMGFKACAILLPAADGHRMYPEGAYGLSQRYLAELAGPRVIKLRNSLTTGPTARAFTTGVPVVVSDTATDPIFRLWRSLAEADGFGSMVSVPLLLQDKPIGVLNGYSQEPGAVTAADLPLLQAVAAQAAIAIELARRLESQAQTITQLEQAAATLRQQQNLLERSEEIHRELTELVLTDAGLAAIIRTVARLTGNPVLLWDQFQHLLTLAEPAPEEAAGTEPGSASPWADLLRAPGLQRHLAALPRGRRPLVVPASPGDGLPHAVALAPVLVGSRLHGYMALVERHQPVGPLDLRALEHAATVVALEFTKQLSVAETERRLREDFVRSLLHHQYDGEEAMVQRGRLYGCDLRSPHRVMVFAAVDLARFAERNDLHPAWVGDSLLQATAEVCKARAPGAMVSTVGNKVVALCPAGGEEAGPAPFHRLARQVLERVKTQIPGLVVSVGIGQVCRTPADYVASYNEAQQCVHLLNRLGQPGRSLALDDLGIFRVLLFNIRDPRALARQVGRLLEPLVSHDRARDADLFRTLAVYLQHNCDPRATARALFIHANTLKYRLGRIAQLTGKNLKNPYHLLELALAVATAQSVGGPGQAEGAGGPPPP